MGKSGVRALAQQETPMRYRQEHAPLLPGDQQLTVYDLWLWLDAVLRHYGPDVQLAANWPVTQGPATARPIIDARVWRAPTEYSAVLIAEPEEAPVCRCGHLHR
jgi:hypothetical protein